MKKLLVANRSEIACRIFQSCREMGLMPVALLAPGDESARHITYADEVLAVPSYLDVESIVEAAKAARVDLIHPGYGFLSERPQFVAAVEKAGMTFVGPDAETMLLMGDKIQAKDLAEKSDVPTLPWTRLEEGYKVSDLKRAAKKIGFPLLLKAAAGGGGKGMRKVEKEADLEESAASAQREAMAAFGDGALFMEKLLLEPRHIEVQVFGDGQGGGVHLFERECSLQRRHQKVWEEARAPHLPSQTCEQMLNAALNLVKATRYRGAGTVEFLYDEKNFYFLEMNTRLQVEHPVSEHVTGVDLVRAQIELALNPKLMPIQAAIARGHSIEVRVYAEDPAQGFMPTPGRVEKLIWPTGAGIRVDSGLEEGQEVTTGFDPMLAKIIVTAGNRAQAIARMRVALAETVILGLGTNLAYLQAISQLPAVQNGKMHTALLEKELGNFTPQVEDWELDLLGQALAQGLAGRTPTLNTATQQSFRSPWFEGAR